MSKNTNIADLINYISVDGSGNVVLTTGGQVATQSYVTTAVSNLVNSAPSTLDTLNELAAALGNDANFATTVTNSIATKQAQLNGTGFVKVSGTTVSYDNSTYLTTTSASSNYVTLSTLQTISGLKTFDATISANYGIALLNGAIPALTSIYYAALSGNSTGISITYRTGGGTNYTNNLNFPDLNNSYLFPSASGTLALTSDLGAYLPLTGGTLTGALSGTSATFSSRIDIGTRSGGNIRNLNIYAATNGNAIIKLDSTDGNGYGSQIDYISKTGSGTTNTWTVGTGVTAGNNEFEFFNGASTIFKLAQTGAATFSSSVTAASGVIESGGFNIKGTGGVAKPDMLRLSNASAGGYYWDIWRDNTTGYLNFGAATGGSVSTFLTIKDVTGNVGIGTSSPQTPLQILKDTNTNGTNIEEANMAFSVLSASGQSKIAIGACNAGNYGYIQVMQDATSWTNRNLTLQPRGGSVGVGTYTPSDKLQVVGSLRWGSATNNLVSFADGGGVYMELSAPNSSTRNLRIQGINNAGNKYSAIRLEAGIEEIAFVTADVERMRISSPGDLYLYNGSIQQQGVWTVFNTGYTDGTSSFNFDISVGDEGGGGNIFKVEAGFAHYFGMAYNCLAEFYISTRGTGSEITDVIRRDTSLAGSFTAWKTTSTVLRVNKSAGTYPGGGRYWIKVTKVNY